MLKDEIEIAINRGSDIIISYSKDGGSTSVFHLTDVKYSEKYGKNYITGLNGEVKLTFKIERIISIEAGWVDIFDRDICSIYDGLYLIAFNGPWFLEYELVICEEGDKILYGRKENGIGIYDYSPDNSLAYHYIPLFSTEVSDKWIRYRKDIVSPQQDGIYIVAFRLDKPEIKNRERKWIRSTWRHSDGIYYSIFIYDSYDLHQGYKPFSFPDTFLNPHIEILAYYFLFKFPQKLN